VNACPANSGELTLPPMQKMRTLTTIPILFLTITVLGQVDVNQQTDLGQKTGKWVTLHDNGKTGEVKFYEPAKRKLSKEEAFFHGITPDKDTTVFYEELLWTEKYEYTDNWDLKRIERKERSQKLIYLYGPNKEIGVNTDNFYFIGKVDTTKTVSIEMINNTDSPIVLKPESSPGNITTANKEFVIPANQSSIFTLVLTIEPNDNTYIVTLKNDSIIIDFSIRIFGYHVESNDIERGQQLTVKKSFVYHRTGNEALLKLYDKNKERELKTISLANHRTTIDLEKIKPGDYWLCTIDYSSDQRTYCKIIIEK
jgi:hypothetical protein